MYICKYVYIYVYIYNIYLSIYLSIIYLSIYLYIYICNHENNVLYWIIMYGSSCAQVFELPQS